MKLYYLQFLLIYCQHLHNELFQYSINLVLYELHYQYSVIEYNVEIYQQMHIHPPILITISSLNLLNNNTCQYNIYKVILVFSYFFLNLLYFFMRFLF